MEEIRISDDPNKFQGSKDLNDRAFFWAQIPFILWSLGPKCRLFGSLDLQGSQGCTSRLDHNHAPRTLALRV